MKHAPATFAFALLLALATPVASVAETLSFPVRGKTLTLTVYRPSGKVKGTVLMGSGDVGWVGLAVEMSEFLASQGYCAIGINVREYLAAFTSGRTTLTTKEPPLDYGQMAAFLRERNLLAPPVVVSGVSEGAALAVLAASAPANHQWIHGVLTMGLPPTAELGWRWSDFTSWLTKKDPDEPMFAPREFVPHVAPLPLCLIHSTKDEYVTAADIKVFDAAAREPKKLVLIDASNHRFTDRKPELKQQLMTCLMWIHENAAVPGAPSPSHTR
ncbi:MAG: alpha/beta hydrolase family protein [Bacteroidales bacterium]